MLNWRFTSGFHQPADGVPSRDLSGCLSFRSVIQVPVGRGGRGRRVGHEDRYVRQRECRVSEGTDSNSHGPHREDVPRTWSSRSQGRSRTRWRALTRRFGDIAWESPRSSRNVRRSTRARCGCFPCAADKPGNGTWRRRVDRPRRSSASRDRRMLPVVMSFLPPVQPVQRDYSSVVADGRKIIEPRRTHSATEWKMRRCHLAAYQEISLLRRAGILRHIHEGRAIRRSGAATRRFQGRATNLAIQPRR
jgi:hypothetical protein